MSNELVTIEKALSPERLSPYRSVTGNDLAAAIKLYRWNSAISAAFWSDIGHLEVFVRNAMHIQLTAASLESYGHPRWYDDPGKLLTQHRIDDITTARFRLRQANKPYDPGRVIAELNFGFWRYLAASQHDRKLWKPILMHGFPGQPRRRHVHNRLAHLHQLRNRLAHHEPIHHVPLQRRHDELLTVIEWINPVLRSWVEQQSTVPTMLTTRPVVAHGDSFGPFTPDQAEEFLDSIPAERAIYAD